MSDRTILPDGENSITIPPRNEGTVDSKKRRIVEKTISERIVRDVLGAGYTITIHNGERLVLVQSAGLDEILEALFSSGEDNLKLYANGVFRHWIYLVYGRGGHDVIADHSFSAEAVLAGAKVLARDIAAGRLDMD
ncbi:hypothetical protein [Labrys miyagiensis]